MAGDSERAHVSKLVEAVALMLMQEANDAEDRGVVALPLVARDAVEALYSVLDVLEGPRREALAKL